MVGSKQKEKKIMNVNYPFKHWLSTLLIAPFLPTLYELVFNPIKGQIVGLLEVYPIILSFSFFFSGPTFLFYYLTFSVLKKKQSNAELSKLILISLTVVGIVITLLLIGGSLSFTFILSYSLAATITGILFSIKNKSDKT